MKRLASVIFVLKVPGAEELHVSCYFNNDRRGQDIQNTFNTSNKKTSNTSEAFEA